ncbi:GNAT family N-acetyltransferase [Agromyces albus]|nr:GNAT family N-acetyltransferase [Agromyces albus]
MAKMEDAPAVQALIRPATESDVEVIHRFIVELAKAEDFPGTVTARPEDVADALFAADAVAEAVVAVVDGEPAGFALFYPTYSTVLGRRGIHLEDLYVSERHRGSGLGREILAHLANVAVQRGCARLEWWVLRTNVAALRFYARLQARDLDEIEILRLDGRPLLDLASSVAGEALTPRRVHEASS